MTEIEIGWAKPDEWSDTMQMVWRTFLEFEGKIYSQAGIKDFFDFITNDKLYQNFLRGNYQMMVARLGDKIVGMGSVRSGYFLSLLFVEKEFHRQGIGSQLLEHIKQYLKEETGEKMLVVKAAIGAEEFYQKNGFVIVGEQENYNGVLVTPMETRL